MNSLVEAQKPHVKEFVSRIKTESKLSLDSPQHAVFVLDNFVTGMNGFPYMNCSNLTCKFDGGL
jgi:hypothetical protein